jgi:hypothetical protein
LEPLLERGVDFVEDGQVKLDKMLLAKAKGMPIVEPLLKTTLKSWENDVQFRGGVTKGLGGLVGGTLNMLTHPVETVKGIESLIEHVPLGVILPVLSPTLASPLMLQGLPDLVRKDAGKGKNPLSLSSVLMMNPLKTERMMWESMMKGQDPRAAMRESMDPDKNLSADGKFWSALGSAFIQPYQKAVDEGKPMEAVGRGAFEVASLLVGGAEAKAGKVASESATVAKTVGKVTEVAQKAERVTEVAQTASKVTEVVGGTEKAIGAAGDVSQPTKILTKPSQKTNLSKNNNDVFIENSSRGGKDSNIGRRVEDQGGVNTPKEKQQYIGANAGHDFAKGKLEGGRAEAMTGHGEYWPEISPPTITQPHGTTLSMYVQHGKTIESTLGLLIEAGDYNRLAHIFNNPHLYEAGLKWQKMLTGAQSYLPGAVYENYMWMRPNREASVRINSSSVNRATPLSDVIQPNMGHLDWAVCRKIVQ